MQTEDDDDAGKPSLGAHRRRHRVRGRLVRVQPGRSRCCKDVSFQRRARHDDRARRLERLRQEHAHQPGDGVQPAAARAASWSTASDLDDVPLRDYREQLASVLQENFLFDGTIAENIGYAKPGASLDEIKRRVPQLAHCEEFILQVPRGLRHRRRRARHQAVGRPASARVDRARHSGRARAS